MHIWPGMSSFGRSDLQWFIIYAPATVPAKKSSLGSKAAVESVHRGTAWSNTYTLNVQALTFGDIVTLS